MNPRLRVDVHLWRAVTLRRKPDRFSNASARSWRSIPTSFSGSLTSKTGMSRTERAVLSHGKVARANLTRYLTGEECDGVVSSPGDTMKVTSRNVEVTP